MKSTSKQLSGGRHAAALLLFFGLSFFVQAGVAYAGFGITPPYLKNDRLTHGTSFQQQITLVRSDPIDDLNVDITKNLPGFESWISIDKGTHFTIPAGVSQMPIIITVQVPNDAAYKVYQGAIRIRTSSARTSGSSAVSIALGAQVDVALSVVDKIKDFDVRRIRLADLEEGYRRWGLFFPGKIRFFMTIQNTGNTEYGPTHVHMDIYDADETQLMESTDNTNAIETIAPFAIKEVIAELPTRLPAGRYQAKYTIYKGNDIAQQGDVTLGISAIGAVAGYHGYGFEGLSLPDKLKVACVLGVPLLLIILFFGALIMRRRRRLPYGR